MKNMSFLVVVVLNFCVSSALCQSVPGLNDPIKYPRQVISESPDSINDIPISYYLSHPDIDGYSKLYVQGKFSASDDTLTFAILDSAATDNMETRDFYLFVFHKIMDKSDGALSEAVAWGCANYFTKHTCAFFHVIKHGQYSAYTQDWIGYINYNGLWQPSRKNEVIKNLKENLARYCHGKHRSELDEIISSLENEKH